MISKNVTLSKEELDWITILMETTGVFAKDCVIYNGDRIIFLISPVDKNKVIGYKGETIRRLRMELKKEVEVVLFSDNPEEFAKNTIAPVRPQEVLIQKTSSGKNLVKMLVNPQDKGRAIGKGGRIFKRAQLLLKRHFDIEKLIITSK